MSETVSAALRRLVRVRARSRCEYCQTPEAYATQAFSIEHIHPLCRQGSSSLENLALSCQGCNNHKFTRIRAADPLTESTVTLFHPRRHEWQDHFAWHSDGCHVIGLTPTGRATVETLRLNRPGLVGLRQALISIGIHPPL